MELFPVEINRAPKEVLIRVPGIGIRGAQKIIRARRFAALRFETLKKLGVSLKRAHYFVTIGGRYYGEKERYPEQIRAALLKPVKRRFYQPSLFDTYMPAATGEI